MKRNLYQNFLLTLIAACVVIFTIKTLTEDNNDFELVSDESGLNFLLNHHTGEIRHFAMQGTDLILFQKTTIEDLDVNLPPATISSE